MLEPIYSDLVKQNFMCGLLPLSIQVTIKASLEAMYESWKTGKSANSQIESTSEPMKVDGREYTVTFTFIEPTPRRREVQPWILHIY
jgi:hypothetical protein